MHKHQKTLNPKKCSHACCTWKLGLGLSALTPAGKVKGNGAVVFWGQLPSDAMPVGFVTVIPALFPVLPDASERHVPGKWLGKDCAVSSWHVLGTY